MVFFKKFYVLERKDAEICLEHGKTQKKQKFQKKQTTNLTNLSNFIRFN
jgi:hypothetical protein